MAEYQSILVKWPAIVSEDPRLNGKEEFELEVPPAASGLLDVWACPPYGDCPAGYWFNLDTKGRYYDKAEPGCDSNDKVLLCSIRFTDITDGDGITSVDGESVPAARAAAPVVEYCHPDVKLDTDELKGNESLMDLNVENVEEEA